MQNLKRALLLFAALGLVSLGAPAQTPPKLEFVIVDNLGHLPMIVGAEKGIFKQHGVDVQLKIVKSGSEIVKALKANEVQGGNMSVTTFIKGRQGGEPVSVFALAMNDATRSSAFLRPSRRRCSWLCRNPTMVRLSRSRTRVAERAPALSRLCHL